MSATETERVAKLARQSRRNVANEATLVWTAIGGSIIFFAPGYMPFWLWDWIGSFPNPLVILILFAVSLGGIIALAYRLWAGKKVNAAKRSYDAYVAAIIGQREAEKMAKLALIRERNTG